MSPVPPNKKKSIVAIMHIRLRRSDVKGNRSEVFIAQRIVDSTHA